MRAIIKVSGLFRSIEGNNENCESQPNSKVVFARPKQELKVAKMFCKAEC